MLAAATKRINLILDWSSPVALRLPLHHEGRLADPPSARLTSHTVPTMVSNTPNDIPNISSPAANITPKPSKQVISFARVNPTCNRCKLSCVIVYPLLHAFRIRLHRKPRARSRFPAHECSAGLVRIRDYFSYAGNASTMLTDDSVGTTRVSRNPAFSSS